MMYSESEIAQTNRQLVEAQATQGPKPVDEIVTELVELVASGPILPEDRKSLEKLVSKIRKSKAETESLLLDELDNSGNWGKDANRNSI